MRWFNRLLVVIFKLFNSFYEISYSRNPTKIFCIYLFMSLFDFLPYPLAAQYKQAKLFSPTRRQTTCFNTEIGCAVFATFFYSSRSESKRIWILFASYSHVSVYPQTPFIRIIFILPHSQTTRSAGTKGSSTMIGKAVWPVLEFLNNQWGLGSE